jgi:hypothetical protein
MLLSITALAHVFLQKDLVTTDIHVALKAV